MSKRSHSAEWRNMALLAALAALAAALVTGTLLYLGDSSAWREAAGLAAAIALVLAPVLTWRLFTRLADLESTREWLEVLSRMDDLTGIINRRHFIELAMHSLSLGRRHGYPVALLLLDIDFFKRVNDLYGHQAGDQILIQVARLIQDTARTTDTVARFGGEEFVILSPHTSLAQATELAERIRSAFEATPLRFEGHSIRLTASIGVASTQTGYNAGTLDELVHWADVSMYMAKRSGRNRVDAALRAGAEDEMISLSALARRHSTR